MHPTQIADLLATRSDGLSQAACQSIGQLQQLCQLQMQLLGWCQVPDSKHVQQDGCSDRDLAKAYSEHEGVNPEDVMTEENQSDEQET